jgi:hypothetical protein
MESLYVLTLQYLRKNYRLIDFTALDADTSSDMAEIMADPYHLSEHSDLKCRYWYNYDDLHLYIAEYHLDSKWVIEVPAPDLTQHARFGLARAPSSRFVYMTSFDLYDRHADKYYNFNHPIDAKFKHNVYSVEIKHMVNLPERYSRVNECTEIVEDRAFDILPGYLEWAEKYDVVSKQITIPRRMILKKQVLCKK